MSRLHARRGRKQAECERGPPRPWRSCFVPEPCHSSTEPQRRPCGAESSKGHAAWCSEVEKYSGRGASSGSSIAREGVAEGGPAASRFMASPPRCAEPGEPTMTLPTGGNHARSPGAGQHGWGRPHEKNASGIVHIKASVLMRSIVRKTLLGHLLRQECPREMATWRGCRWRRGENRGTGRPPYDVSW